MDTIHARFHNFHIDQIPNHRIFIHRKEVLTTLPPMPLALAQFYGAMDVVSLEAWDASIQASSNATQFHSRMIRQPVSGISVCLC